MTYLYLKHLHVTAAALSIVFFIIRACWSVQGSPRLQSRFVRIAPHIIDTVLLLAGIYLASVLGWHQPWIAAKIVGLVLYIVVGTMAIKRGKTPAGRAVAAIVAVIIFLYIVGVAITKQPMSWLA
ncbi:SirB2 family protein [Pusillimonas noertemannii]|uniref:Putative membrane protein SirB2 n=1 Tax=Pusillimonas noertemannii TaxID=305977 RepID=A0A2U1CSG3_9BURK|nr:SirB2 family protein [Pusillimonas noertemannii]NYT68162.1 SirB2 family protein [Pusillimonas noertemannii]PVY68838.1 putative membrane protein SirB2 [Pusillimonas noertemannii]TFL11707.1 regulator SirB [Pusillimonas noertemannii]